MIDRSKNSASTSRENIKFSCTMSRCLSVKVMKEKGWKEVEPESMLWDFIWADVGWIHENMPYGITGQLVLSEGQRVNHFPNHIELTRKDLLAKNYRRAKKALEREGRHEELERFNFLPTTYTLPSENVMFLEEFKRGNHNHNSMWILKPVGKAQGRGIFLTSKLTHISEWIRDRGDKNDYVEPYVAQRPYLRCYLYREGFARFSTYRYTTHRDDIDNDFVHLTNVAIQKKGENYDSRTGMKWSLESLRRHFTTIYGSEIANKAFEQVKDLIINSLSAVQHIMISDKHCYELYGFDVMFDEKLKPWLLEVNASPSMTPDTQADRELKTNLLHDTITVVNMDRQASAEREREAFSHKLNNSKRGEYPYKEKLPPTIGGFDVIYDGGPVKPHATVKSFLGCPNPNKRQISVST